MSPEYYSSLPQKMAKRAELYLEQAEQICADKLPLDVTDRSAKVIQLANAMMGLEAAEVIAASSDSIADNILEPK